jgi:hypothetical protein
MYSPRPSRKAWIISSVLPASSAIRSPKATPRLWQAYLNMAIGWPPWSISTSRPASLFQENSGSALRPVTKNPSRSLIWAKWATGGVWPRSRGPKPWAGADWATWAVPSSSEAMADLPGCDTRCTGSSPWSFRNPPAMVMISGL